MSARKTDHSLERYLPEAGKPECSSRPNAGGASIQPTTIKKKRNTTGTECSITIRVKMGMEGAAPFLLAATQLVIVVV